jgi:hypothetical protein
MARIAVIVLLLLWSLPALAEEARCTELGANCFCSEPFQMTGFTQSGGGSFWNPTDSTTKECTTEAANHPISRNTQDIQVSTDATAMAALPAGHTAARFVRAGNGHTGIFWMGSSTAIPASYTRIAARWYIWHTPVFDFKPENACTNSKIAEFDFSANARVDYTNGFHSYGYTSPWTPSIDCCFSGPGPAAGTASSNFKGKWWRFEAVMTHRAGPNFRIQFYAKNITDNGPELTLIDLYDSNWSGAQGPLYPVNLTPPYLLSALLVNNYRQDTCQGWLGVMYYMTAGWTTDAGQRIGVAPEVEGGGGGSAPSIPTNFHLTSLAALIIGAAALLGGLLYAGVAATRGRGAGSASARVGTAGDSRLP